MSKMMSSFLVDLPTPSSISYLWNFGSLLGVFMFFQIITGLMLSLQFSGDLNLSFLSLIHIMRDVNSGWVIRVLHSNGASMFFVLLYFHLGRGFYYGSYFMKKVWISGNLIFLLAMSTAFLGYVLPWGQMSFWAATVITNLMSAVPYFGNELVEWLWGGYSVGNPTLTRFFSFHFLLPFIILIMMIFHMIFLHDKGSSNPLGSMNNCDKVSFQPYFVLKDIFGLMIVFFFFIEMSLYVPFFFMDSENFLESNSLVTPIHIQPEWYFLFAYTILRSLPSKIGGVVALIFSIFIFFTFSFLSKGKFQSNLFYPMSSIFFWVIVVNWVLLTWNGSCVVEYPFMQLGQVFSMNYFFFFMVYFLIKNLQDKVV